jgi:putative PIG3 family NAD(P)H quinone oxidoreductase
MRVIEIADDQRLVEQVGAPLICGPTEVRIQVVASGLNRADILQRRGLYPPPPGASPLLGLEVSGIVREVGDEVTRWDVGDEVCALLAGGGYAEECIVRASHCLPVPRGVALEDAAALPEAVFTVWANLFHTGILTAGMTLLAQGGSSGIGTMAIQMAKAFGANVIATAGSDRKVQACVGLGCEAAFDYHDDWAGLAKPYEPDVILDIIGAEYFARHLDQLKVDVTLVCFATSRGREATLDIGAMRRKRLRITGSTLRGRSVPEKAALAREVEDAVWPKIESGAIAPVIDRKFPAAQAQAAHEWMESGQHIGKILLTWA